jgi:hypothetical protein
LTSLLALLVSGLRVSGVENKAVAQFQTDVQPILREYCYDCHGDGMNKGKVAFDELKSDDAILDHELWTKAIKNVRAGLMPPQKKPRPTAEDQKRLENWIKYSAFGLDPNNPDPGRVTVRRLNRVEYRNTIRDLMGVDFRADEELPPDDTGYGFDNIGDVLSMSPLLLEKYMQAAEAIVADAVPRISRTPKEILITGKQFHGSGDIQDDNPAGRNLAVRPAGGENALSLSYYTSANVSHSVNVEQAGKYRLVLNLGARGDFDFDPGKCKFIFKVDGHEAWQKEFEWQDRPKFRFEVETNWQSGEHQLAFELQPLTPLELKHTATDMQIFSVAVQGPLAREYWTYPKNYERFFSSDEPPNSKAARQKYAREVLSRFATKAFRRPVDDRMLNRLVAFAEDTYSQPGKSFEEGIARAMVVVLSSPRFLFRVEAPDTASTNDRFALLDEYSLASRLSYFLWSTMPDDELFGLAGRGELRKNLGAQVNRMLKDRRSQAMIENFTGQWLQVRDLEGINIDARVVLARDNNTEAQMRREDEELRAFFSARAAQRRQPQTNQAASGPATQTNETAVANQLVQAIPVTTNQPTADQSAQTNAVARAGRRGQGQFRRRAPPAVELDRPLRDAMRRETEMYFAYVVREDRSVLELLDSDYTFLNERLAKVYGLTNLNVTGSEMRRVTLPENCPRGGVLTHGAVLAVTSNPTRTSPVKRGLFILDNFMGTPPPPPPPNIPALEDAEKQFKDHDPTLKESLEAHRNTPLCSACHSRMDPLGLALENFNPLGMWREKERGQVIETPGKLITGESFQDIRELKHLLANERRMDFYRCLTEKLLTYALGRGPEYYDVETMDQIVARLEKEGGHFSALLMGIVESAPFQKERSQTSPPPAAKSQAVKQTAKN